MMDFGEAPKSTPETKSKFKKLLLLLFIVIIGGTIAAGLYLHQRSQNPLPSDIKSQISYKFIYPREKTGAIEASSYKYQANTKTLTFSVHSAGTKIVFTEQPAPENLGSASQAYYPAIGIHPYAQFQSKLGSVALAKFYESGSLKPRGQSAILAASGTLLIAHPDKDLTNGQWKDLFDSLKITK